jgi:hypothetical protein
MIEFDPSSKTALCEQAKLRDDKLVKLADGLVWGNSDNSNTQRQDQRQEQARCHGRTHLLRTQLHRLKRW